MWQPTTKIFLIISASYFDKGLKIWYKVACSLSTTHLTPRHPVATCLISTLQRRQRRWQHPSKHETFIQDWFNVGPPSATLDQHWTKLWWTSSVCWDSTHNVGLPMGSPKVKHHCVYVSSHKKPWEYSSFPHLGWGGGGIHVTCLSCRSLEARLPLRYSGFRKTEWSCLSTREDSVLCGDSVPHR